MWKCTTTPASTWTTKLKTHSGFWKWEIRKIYQTWQGLCLFRLIIHFVLRNLAQYNHLLTNFHSLNFINKLKNLSNFSIYRGCMWWKRGLKMDRTQQNFSHMLWVCGRRKTSQSEWLDLDHLHKKESQYK